MATGDVVLRLGERPPAPERVLDLREQAHVIDPAIAEEARRERIKQAEMRREAARQDEKPVPEPWDAWRNQRAPALFEAEVTNRG